MAIRTKITTRGFEEYYERLAKAGKDIDAATDEALLVGAEILRDEIRDHTPIDTGNLLEHIRIKGPIRDGNSHYIEVGIIPDLAFTDKKTAIYAGVQEYGSSNVPPHPFIRPGIDLSKRSVIAAMKKSLVDDGLL